MSRYTTEVRYICESLAGLDKSVGYSNVNEVIEKSRNRIFPPFEIFDESYRPVLETKILKHFYTREIGAETFGLWQLRLDAKLSVIMPYYNKLYKAINLDIPVIDNVNMSVEHNIDRNADTKVNDNTDITASSQTTTSTNSNSKIRHSDTPQGSLEDLESNEYMTDATISDNTQSVNSSTNSTSNSTGNSNTNAKSTEEYAERRWGKEGTITYISMVSEYIEKLKNVDAMLIKELEDLFMQVWDIWE
uniref:Lower collar protein n=1 Tax=Podoviridae sp. ct2nF21 TaxID=2826537 RepID=A0A8S5NFS9_9CAUD|nr:MAG TPA: Lower collar protein [Podoviridae sp. ct2nF21]